jgi:type III secretion protein V
MNLNVRRNRFNDLILSVFVLLIASMLLVPLPTILLDFLITINLAFSLLLLLVGLYLPTSLDLLSFPSLLLLTTLFRLALNVASSRLILSNGDAGQVIHSFGLFLIRGEVVVGLIIFLIITVVNYLVIAKGASRVSVVAARFALDSLPGRQMSIDADLAAGQITPNEAKLRRESLQRESQLYGAMDGAMNFVQGDAIAGFFIILINIVGGIYIGIQNGLSINDALQAYTVLTVGDGLVSQIPAILISVCAGIVVTRVSGDNEGSLALEISEQIFKQPTTLLITGIIVSCIGFLPGLPSAFFILVGLAFIVSAIIITRNKKGVDSVEPTTTNKLPMVLANSSLPGLIDEELARVQLLLDASWFYPNYRSVSNNFNQFWRKLQTDFYFEMGLNLPNFVTVSSNDLAVGNYEIRLDGLRIASDSAIKGGILIETNPIQARLLGLQVIAEINHPLNSAKNCWVSDVELARSVLDKLKIRYYTPIEFAALGIAFYFAKNPQELFSLADIHSTMKSLDKRFPGFLSETLNQNIVDLPRLARVVTAMSREGIAVKDLKTVIELVANYCSLAKVNTMDDFDFDALFNFIRVQRKRSLLAKVLSSRNTIRVVNLHSSVQEIFEQLPLDDYQENPLPIQPEDLEVLVNSYESIMKPVREIGVLPVAVMVDADVRVRVDLFLKGIKAPERVLCIEELDSESVLDPIGLWSI